MVRRRIGGKNKSRTYLAAMHATVMSQARKRLRSNGAPVYKPRPKIGQSRNRPIGVEALKGRMELAWLSRF
jgi:hypothetical protein